MKVYILLFSWFSLFRTGNTCGQLKVTHLSDQDCHFPFTFERQLKNATANRTIYSCVVGLGRDGPWCGLSQFARLENPAFSNDVSNDLINCNISTVGGNADDGTACDFEDYKGGDVIPACDLPDYDQLPFSWCKTKAGLWGYCAMPPMDTCGKNIAQRVKTNRVSRTFDASGSLDSDVQLAASEFISLQYHNNGIQWTRHSNIKCIVHAECDHIFNSTQYAYFREPRNPDGVLGISICDKDNNCTELKSGQSNDFYQSYFKYDISPGFSGNIYIAVHHNARLRVCCSRQNCDLTPQGHPNDTRRPPDDDDNNGGRPNEKRPPCAPIEVKTTTGDNCKLPLVVTKDCSAAGDTCKSQTYIICGSADSGESPWCYIGDHSSLNNQQVQTCDIRTVGGNASEDSGCAFPFQYDGSRHDNCVEPEDSQLPFSWCRTDAGDWGFCAIPPMNSCGKRLAKRLKDKYTAKTYEAHDGLNQSIQLQAADYVSINFKNDHQGEEIETNCIVYAECGTTFNATQFVWYRQRHIDISGDVLRGYHCDSDMNCEPFENDESNDIYQSYIRYEIAQHVEPSYSGSIYIAVHHDVKLRIACSKQENLIPPNNTIRSTGMEGNKFCDDDSSRCEPLEVMTADNMTCTVPFTFEMCHDSECSFSSCADTNPPGRPWCSYTNLDGQSTKWGYCTIHTVGGNAKEGSVCEFPFEYENNTYYNCTEAQERHLPFSWCGAGDGTWGYCAVPPMTSCTYEFVKAIGSNSATETFTVSEGVMQTVELQASDFISMAFGNNESRRKKRNIASNVTQCIVYEKNVYKFNSTQFVTFTQRNIDQGEALFQAYRCDLSTHCHTSIDGDSTDIHESYLRYVISQGLQKSSGDIFVTVHHEVTLTVMCTNQNTPLIPPGLPITPSDNGAATNTSNRNLYIFIGCGFAGIVLLILVATVTIVLMIRKRKGNRHTAVGRDSVIKIEEEQEEYCTIDDKYIQETTHVNHQSIYISPIGYEEIVDKEKPSSADGSELVDKVPDLPKKRPSKLEVREAVRAKQNIYVEARDSQRRSSEETVLLPDVTPKDSRQSKIDNCDIKMEDNDVYASENNHDGVDETRTSKMVMEQNDVYECEENRPRSDARESHIIMEENNAYNSQADQTGSEDRYPDLLMQDNDLYESDPGESAISQGNDVSKTKCDTAKNDTDAVEMQENDVYNSGQSVDASIRDSKVVMTNNSVYFSSEKKPDSE